jgi:dolichol-phosphate mannosyltransferase
VNRDKTRATHKGNLGLNNITVLVPTLNEVENVDMLISRLLAVQEKSTLSFDILFVDSASSDGTGEKVLNWQGKAPVRLLQRDVNVGLAGAVIAGAMHCTSEYLVVMDADLSHPPEAVPFLLQPLLDDKSDMVIGSRYIEGGATPDWPIGRRISSKLATMPALMFCDVRDPDRKSVV